MIPSVREWYDTYKDQGLVIIGNHFPEFSYEHDIANLREAIERLEVPYPVMQDNDGATWRAFNNRYWPTLYAIDKQGHIRYRHIGEGRYDETEAAILDLLKETYIPDDSTEITSNESYLTATTDLNVRSDPTTNSNILGQIVPGEAHVIHGEQDGWYLIRYNDGEGYVSGEYVTVSGTQAES